MSNLMASLSSAGNSLSVYQNALTVIQNNVDNASTPGFASQQLRLAAMPLDITGGLAGGVAGRGLQSSRDEYADEDVRRQMQASGQFSAQAQGTGSIQNLFDVTGNSGVSAALSTLFQAFSAWSVNPSDPAARQTVLQGAGGVADSIQSLSKSLTSTSGQLDTQIGSTVDQINQLAKQVQQYNVQRLREPTSDPGSDAQLHANLESMAQLANITTFTAGDGTVTVLAGGGTPLVIGDRQYDLSSGVSVTTQPPATNPGSPPSAHILDNQGNDITNQIVSGQLGGILDVRNNVLGSILGDAQHAGTLNQFAGNLGDTINTVLQSGSTASGGPANGLPLFTWDNSDPTRAASSFAVNPAMDASQLAPVDSSGNVNGNALQLASLVSAPQSTLGGSSFVQFFAQIAATVGQANQTATSNDQSQQAVTAQSRSMRDQISGVSLDHEALELMQFQKGYQAAARVLTVLSDLISTTINMIPQA